MQLRDNRTALRSWKEPVDYPLIIKQVHRTIYIKKIVIPCPNGCGVVELKHKFKRGPMEFNQYYCDDCMQVSTIKKGEFNEIDFTERKENLQEVGQ